MVVLKRSFFLESGGLKGAEVDKKKSGVGSWLGEVEAGWWWWWAKEIRKRGEERRRGGVYLQSASQAVKGGIMSDVFFSFLLPHSDSHIVTNIHPLSSLMSAVSMFLVSACNPFSSKKKSSTHCHRCTECISRHQK